jgi:uncharacterized protein (DUF2235 family)
MPILSLLARVFSIFVFMVLSGWWLAGGAMRLLVYGLERGWPLRSGGRAACALVLAAVAIVLAALAGGLAAFAYWALLPEAATVSVMQTSKEMLDAWYGPILLYWRPVLQGLAVLVAAAAMLAVIKEALAGWASAQRRRVLIGVDVGCPAVDTGYCTPIEPSAGHAGRRIVILCDGTSNRPDQTDEGKAAATNIWKLQTHLLCDETQTVWYLPGVGSDTSSTADEMRWGRKLLSGAGASRGAWLATVIGRLAVAVEGSTGSGISENIIKGYAEIVRQYRPGDRIYVLGFSRGAYTARCIAGVISHCGLLRAEFVRYCPEVMQLYRGRAEPDSPCGLRADMMHAGVTVEFLGAFDTVASLGVPLWGWWFRVFPIWRNKALATDPAAVCRYVYHALAMDERRSQFFPTLFADPRPAGQTTGAQEDAGPGPVIRQVWFRGCHADIGGGYAQTGLSDITLGWMMDALERHGLSFNAQARASLRPDPLARTHDELSRQPFWRLFGSWPRWHPVLSETASSADEGVVRSTGPHGVLHDSVLTRAQNAETLLGRPDMLDLAEGQSVELFAEAQRDWDRTGVVIAAGAQYRITYVGGLWRDADKRPCTPNGQFARSLGDLRVLLGWGLRLRRLRWMQMVATVAHPRQWPLREKGLMPLIKLLLHKEPEVLTAQLAAIGESLVNPGDSLVMINRQASGLLYLFANDWWQTASNNSGAIRLRITRLTDGEAAAALDPRWILRANVDVVEDAPKWVWDFEPAITGR